ncbi:MAG: hypothetical protein EBQ78_00570 [Betaproteobacteria bacterium]|nr:hypothetical protein [Betaproteobacteria bacterium]NBY16185.1 hypothetical protein [Betaproteobacteria bacterium]
MKARLGDGVTWWWGPVEPPASSGEKVAAESPTKAPLGPPRLTTLVAYPPLARDWGSGSPMA